MSKKEVTIFEEPDGDFSFTGFDDPAHRVPASDVAGCRQRKVNVLTWAKDAVEKLLKQQIVKQVEEAKQRSEESQKQRGAPGEYGSLSDVGRRLSLLENQMYRVEHKQQRSTLDWDKLTGELSNVADNLGGRMSRLENGEGKPYDDLGHITVAEAGRQIDALQESMRILTNKVANLDFFNSSTSRQQSANEVAADGTLHEHHLQIDGILRRLSDYDTMLRKVSIGKQDKDDTNAQGEPVQPAPQMLARQQTQITELKLRTSHLSEHLTDMVYRMQKRVDELDISLTDAYAKQINSVTSRLDRLEAKANKAKRVLRGRKKSR